MVVITMVPFPLIRDVSMRSNDASIDPEGASIEEESAAVETKESRFEAKESLFEDEASFVDATSTFGRPEASIVSFEDAFSSATEEITSTRAAAV